MDTILFIISLGSRYYTWYITLSRKHPMILCLCIIVNYYTLSYYKISWFADYGDYQNVE